MYIVLYTLLDLCPVCVVQIWKIWIVPIEDYGASRRQDWGWSPRDDRDWGGWRRDEKGPKNAKKSSYPAKIVEFLMFPSPSYYPFCERTTVFRCCCGRQHALYGCQCLYEHSYCSVTPLSDFSFSLTGNEIAMISRPSAVFCTGCHQMFRFWLKASA